MISQCHTDLQNPHFHHSVSTGKRSLCSNCKSTSKKKKKKRVLFYITTYSVEYIICLVCFVVIIFLAVVKCDLLKPSPHGSLQCFDPVEEFAYGSTCWVKCDFGFVHNGTNSTHCTAHGNWSHIPPVCHGNLLLKHYIYMHIFSVHRSNRFTLSCF